MHAAGATDTSTHRLLASSRAAVYAGLEPKLVAAAKQSVLGRRWLAVHLAHQRDAWADLRALMAERRSPMVQDAIDQIEPRILDIGALMFASAIRSTVSRKPLAALREALGAERYAMILAIDLNELDTQWQLQSKKLFEASLKLPETLLPLMFSEGVQELINQLSQTHPISAERLRLEFPLAQAAGKKRVSANLLRQYLDEYAVSIDSLPVANP